MRRLTHIIVLAAFVFSCGGQWYILQCVAWVKMMHDYAQVVPFTEAVSMTFSGKYPCEICKAIAEKKQAENSKVFLLEKYKMAFLLLAALTLARRNAVPFQHPGRLSSLQTRAESPPTPPPRLVLA